MNISDLTPGVRVITIDDSIIGDTVRYQVGERGHVIHDVLNDAFSVAVVFDRGGDRVWVVPRKVRLLSVVEEIGEIT